MRMGKLPNAISNSFCVFLAVLAVEPILCNFLCYSVARVIVLSCASVFMLIFVVGGVKNTFIKCIKTIGAYSNRNYINIILCFFGALLAYLYKYHTIKYWLVLLVCFILHRLVLSLIMLYLNRGSNKNSILINTERRKMGTGEPSN